VRSMQDLIRRVNWDMGPAFYCFFASLAFAMPICYL
jgi:hypothetical protein